MAHRAPDVFNYYLPDYQPAGPVERAALVSPEAQLVVTPQIVGFLNGVLSLADYGLTHCAGGFGSNRAPPNMNCWRAIYGTDDPDDTAKALLGYAPAAGASAAEVVRELDVLLTAGRLSARTRALVEDAYASLAPDDRAGPKAAQAPPGPRAAGRASIALRRAGFSCRQPLRRPGGSRYGGASARARY